MCTANNVQHKSWILILNYISLITIVYHTNFDLLLLQNLTQCDLEKPKFTNPSVWAFKTYTVSRCQQKSSASQQRATIAQALQPTLRQKKKKNDFRSKGSQSGLKYRGVSHWLKWAEDYCLCSARGESRALTENWTHFLPSNFCTLSRWTWVSSMMSKSLISAICLSTIKMSRVRPKWVSFHQQILIILIICCVSCSKNFRSYVKSKIFTQWIGIVFSCHQATISSIVCLMHTACWAVNKWIPWKTISDWNVDTFYVACDRHVISWLLRNANVEGNAMHFLDRNVFILSPCLSPKLKKRLKGNWYVVRRQQLLLLYEVKLRATVKSLLCAYAPVIHTRTPFDFH